MRKKARGSKKGTPFERRICKLLSLWWTNGENSNVFWRTATSGGRATVRHAAGNSSRYHHGDVCAIDPIGQPLLDLVTIEIKKGYSSHTVQDLLDKKSRKNKCQYLEWFIKAEQTADRADTRYWMLIAMRDRREPVLFCPTPMLSFLHWPYRQIIVRYETRRGDRAVTGVRLKDFLKSLGPWFVEKV